MSAPRLVDISPPVDAGIAVFPGDVAFRREVSLDLEHGAHLTLSSMKSTLHLGAHADAPSHYLRGGQSIETRPLERYYGACQVMRVNLPRGERLLPQHLTGEVEAPRLLFCTGSQPDPRIFNPDFNSLSPELIDELHRQGVMLVGIDTPSIDPPSSKALEAHAAVARHDLAILEGLVLSHVPPGIYTLCAFPLALVGAEAAPVRAVLIA